MAFARITHDGTKRLQHFFAAGLERDKSARFVALHEAALADHIGGKNGGKSAFHLLPAEPVCIRLLREF